MTYFGFLALFLGLPILVLLRLLWWDDKVGRELPWPLRGASPKVALGVIIFLAVAWTTPWDNYLVATRVWWYDPALVTGFTIGWVPIEEYTFFILQPILTGLWLLWLARRVPVPSTLPTNRRPHRTLALAIAGLIWLAGVIMLLDPAPADTYLGLELSWALLPIMLQLAFGADILWHYRHLVAAALIPPTLYLAAADALAITAGTWTIDPEQSLPLLIGGLLPIEEALFFLLTNTLVVFGITLVVARVSLDRLATIRAALARRATPHQPAS